MVNLKQYLLFIGLLIFPFYLYAASFDCSKATSWVEKAICADPQLSDLDEHLMVSYKKALSNTTNEASLKSAQRDWIKSVRNVCQKEDCLKEAYTSRLTELNHFVESSSKLPSISGEYVRYYHGKVDRHSSSITLHELKNGQIHVEGNSTWVGNAKIGNVNVGELDGIFKIDGGKIYYNEDGDDTCKLIIDVSLNGLNVSDDNMLCGGLNVSFNGEYRKSGRKK